MPIDPPDGADTITDTAWLHAFEDKIIEAWNSHDPDAVSMLYAPDAVRIDPMRADPIIGRPAIRDYLVGAFAAFPDITYRFEGLPAITPQGTFVFTRWTAVGTHHGRIMPEGIPPTGRRGEIVGVNVQAFRGGLLWHDYSYFDTADLGRQLGLMPARGSRAEKMMIRSRQLQAQLRKLRRLSPR
ncbi:ester cyclase [Smaragdicoccus niigatensis]|uniref:ester cyclase n=1 Tax=Smaragdicoccus niigatensis TaxID=359359 RepID=UPI0003701151|nr:nuclear transport factor 2 family protein [Smaragdicoccus niigatensis]